MTLFDRREFLSWAGAAASQSFANAKQPRKRYLFLDSRAVERAGNAVLRVGKVRKDPRNPLFGEEKPWEARFDNLYANVVREPDTSLYRCWYSPLIVDEAVRTIARVERNRKPYRAMKREMGVCYAESDDGLKWTKPALGLVELSRALCRHHAIVGSRDETAFGGTNRKPGFPSVDQSRRDSARGPEDARKPNLRHADFRIRGPLSRIAHDVPRPLRYGGLRVGLERGHPALGTSGPRQRPDPAGATGSSVSRVCVRTTSPHWNHARRTMPQW